MSPAYDFLDVLFGLKLFTMDKLLSLIIIVVLLSHVLVVKKLYLNMIEFIILLFMVISIPPNLISGGFEFHIVISHLFNIFMPFFAISFGASPFFRKRKLQNQLSKAADISLPILLVLAICYFFLHHATSLWTYFGYSSGLIYAFFLSSNFKFSSFRYIGLSFCETKSSLIIEIVTPGIPRFFCAPA